MVSLYLFSLFFFFKQITAYELRISDWSSDVCSSDLQGRGEAVIEPRMHLEPGVANGHFNVLRGALREPIDSAGVKVVGDFVDNYKHNLPSELAILLLFDPRTGVPKAILDASRITDMRPGAVTALGAKKPEERREGKEFVRTWRFGG